MNDERPFDYPGSLQGDPPADPTEWIEIGGFQIIHDDDGYGGSHTRYHVCAVPILADDEEIDEWVHNVYPARRCEHEYDCCGQYYQGPPQWSRADLDSIYRTLVEDNDSYPLLILVRQGYQQNV